MFNLTCAVHQRCNSLADPFHACCCCLRTVCAAEKLTATFAIGLADVPNMSAADKANFTAAVIAYMVALDTGLKADDIESVVLQVVAAASRRARRAVEEVDCVVTFR